MVEPIITAGIDLLINKNLFQSALSFSMIYEQIYPGLLKPDLGVIIQKLR